MSASVLMGLQAAIYARLTADSGVSALIGDGIYDIPPPTASFPYASFGPVDWSEADAEELASREVALQLDVWSIAADGKREVYEILDAIKASLHLYSCDLGDNGLVEMRVTGGQVMNDPDGITLHGVLTVIALVEETVG
jgi:hypothetical protein